LRPRLFIRLLDDDELLPRLILYFIIRWPLGSLGFLVMSVMAVMLLAM